ncbi:unnamed protein product, partial [Meganyctiphanes norvegica]
MIWLILIKNFINICRNFLRYVHQITKISKIYWSRSYLRFRIDNTDHIIDVNQGSLPFEYDQVNIICPVYSRDVSERDAEKYIIYNVNKEEYDTCRITEPNPRRIAICNHPYKLMYFTITFRSFTPQPGGLEFKPGQDYYFISTSSKDDLYRRIGGRCTTHHMKVVFKVCCDPASKPAHDQAGQHVNNGLSTPRGTTTTTITTTKSTTTISTLRSTTTSLPTLLTTPSYRSTSHKNKDPHSNRKTSGKSDIEGRDDKEDEEMKNKKLALNGSSRSVPKPFLQLYVLSILVFAIQIFYFHAFPQYFSSWYARPTKEVIIYRNSVW